MGLQVARGLSMGVGMINIKGIPKAELLAALFNASKQQGFGLLNPSGTVELTTEEATAILADHPPGQRFDYLRGRVMKVNISGDELNPGLFDRDNGEGAAQRAIAGLPLAAT